MKIPLFRSTAAATVFVPSSAGTFVQARILVDTPAASLPATP